MSDSQVQAELFDRIASDYDAHYTESYSMKYRERFIYEPMFQGMALADRSVLDAMCGGGQTAKYLVSKGAKVTGVDISEKQVELFRARFPNSRAVCSSVLDMQLESDSFDAVVVFFGLHHVGADVNKAVSESHRVLKKGGYFCFAEPHRGSLPDLARKLWYKMDRKLFGEGETAIDVPKLRGAFEGRFEFCRESYLGNIAYLLVYNSLVFRMPLRLKPYYSPFCMGIESAINRIQPRWASCYIVGQWRKR